MKAVYPGSFDPLTNGHLDIIKRASNLFNIVIAVLENPTKKTLFTVKERMDLIKESVKDSPNVTISTFNGLLVDFMKENNIKIAIRGMRAISDFDYEFQMALTNKELYDKMETIFMVSKGEYAFISSSLVKEISKFRGDISHLVPEPVKIALYKKFFK